MEIRKKQQFSDIFDITNEELLHIKKQMKDGDVIVLYNSEKVKCKLMKLGKKVYEIINYYTGDKTFKEKFKEMAQIRYGYVSGGKNNEISN